MINFKNVRRSIVFSLCLWSVTLTPAQGTQTVVPEASQEEVVAMPSLDEILSQDSFKVVPARHPEAQKTTTLLISCIDSDLRDEVQDFMENTLNLKDTYDEFMMPGASLSYLQMAYPEWSRTLEDVIKMAKNNQGISRVIFLDHLDCQAYKLLQPAYARQPQAKQLESHKRTFAQVRKKISKLFPDLKIHTLVMDSQGNILNIKE
ncbi:MAG: carbonic anhydrase [Alphaproteobacteria bacterium]|jgi:hypothetical protein|nr:hypothetical protein [Alphaproteobacteria bacterium]